MLIRKTEHSWAADWVNSYKLEEAHLLIPTGENEQYQLAKRLRKHVAAIFEQPYTPLRYVFQTTQVSRSSQRCVHETCRPESGHKPTRQMCLLQWVGLHLRAI